MNERLPSSPQTASARSVARRSRKRFGTGITSCPSGKAAPIPLTTCAPCTSSATSQRPDVKPRTAPKSSASASPKSPAGPSRAANAADSGSASPAKAATLKSARRPSLTFRARDDLYDRLKAAADENGRSLSEEIEARLEWSFAGEETVRQTIHLL